MATRKNPAAARKLKAVPRASSREGRTITVSPDVVPLFQPDAQVERLVTAFGNNTVAELLGVSRSQPSRWRAGRERIGPESRRRVADLDHLLDRLLLELWPDQIGMWLETANPHLGGARPLDALKARGAAAVLPAVNALSQGAFA